MLDAKFNELLAHLPPPPAAAPHRPGYVGHAQRVPREQGKNSGVAAAVDEPFDYYEGEDEYEGVDDVGGWPDLHGFEGESG